MCENCGPEGGMSLGDIMRLMGIRPPDPMDETRSNVAKHEVRDFIIGLNADQRRTLTGIINVVSQAPGSAPFYVGIISTIQDFKDNICFACGKNHDDMVGELLESAIKPEVANHPSMFKAAAKPPSKEEVIQRINEAKDKVAEPDEGPSMEQYNLHLVKGRLLCKNCGTEYVSVEDRALRPEGIKGCDGCIQKEKWG